jgi:hypothetical protein
MESPSGKPMQSQYPNASFGQWWKYLSGKFKVYLKKCGIKQELTVPHTPQQNGVAERLNRTLLDSVRTMLKHKNCEKMWWAEAVSTACYIKNRVTRSGIPNNIAPHEIWYGRKPNIAHLRIFGSKCWYVIPKMQTRKLDDGSCEAMMIGWVFHAPKGYKLLDAKLKRMVVLRDAIFAEAPGISNNISDAVLEEGLGINSSVRGFSGTNFVKNGEKEDTISTQVNKIIKDSDQIARETGGSC